MYLLVAWGAGVRPGNALAASFLSNCRALGVRPRCLGKNGDGSPCHPLRLAKTTPLVLY